MESLFAQLYLALVAHIKANVPEIKWIDLDVDQLETTDRPPVLFPCVLIDFPTAEYSNLSRLQQWADVNISIRLGFAPFSSTNGETPEIYQEAALQYFEIENKLYQALAGFTADDCVQPLIRVSATTERRDDTYRVRSMMFTTGTEDSEATLPVNVVEADLDITGELTS